MRLLRSSVVTCATACVLTTGLLAATAPAPVAAQAAADDDATTTPGVEDPDAKPRFGVGLRLRRVSIPTGLLELFVERAESGVSGTGFGFDLVRRNRNFELQVGFEYESLKGDPGIWIDKGESIPADPVDYVEYRGFGWYTFEVSFLNHTPLAKQVSLRYGGGAGLGVLKGDVVRTDYLCSSAQTESCTRDPAAANDQTPYDLPPVFPVVNAIIGVQIRPIDNLTINVETGLRTVLFFGTSVGYLF
ncbi:MAG: hypothetical protein KA190_27595 [Kofleriaceae bacterium]|jgi:hypothetical protein|nr:hypothetical protein [Kofleriaceae bacterium]